MPNINPEDKLRNTMQNINPDPEFKNNLRSKLLNEIKLILNNKNNMENNNNIFSRKLLFSALGIGVALVALFVVTQAVPSFNNQSSTKLGFGTLPSFEANQGGRGAGGGGGSPSTAELATTTATENVSTVDSSMKVPGYGGGGGDFQGEYLPPKVSYTWNGTLPEASTEYFVFKDKQIKAEQSLLGYLSKMSGLNFFRKLKTPAIENVSFYSPETNMQYSLEKSGRFNIWTRNFNYNEEQVKNVLSDEETIEIANRFLSELGIQVNDFEKPYVDRSWLQYATYENTPEGSSNPDTVIWAPQDLTVYYPMKLDGKMVVGYGGNVDPGLTVNVNMKNKNVTNVNGRFITQKDKSLYPAEEESEIVKYALSGGLNPLWGWANQTFTPEQEGRRPKINVELKESYIGIIQTFNYQDITNDSYWIPVYVFTGTYVDEYGNQQNYSTMVSAIKGDFFQEPPYRIMAEQ